MSILYRPVVKKQGDMYAIEPYSGTLNPKPFLEVGMDVHFGALFFLLGLSTDLLSDTLNSLKEMEVENSYKPILEKSGEAIQQSLS